MSECTEPALTTPQVGDDAVSTISSLVSPASPTAVGISWEHDKCTDDHMPANILSHFYQGMSVHALHCGSWYAARVVTVQQPPIKTVTDAILRAVKSGDSFGFNSFDELREMSKKIRCLVHYLGWNSRYDEYMKLPQIRITQKDNEASIKLARPRLPEALLEWVGNWSRTRDGMAALCGPFDKVASMGGLPMSITDRPYRPRKISFSQVEQLSAVTSPLAAAVSPSLSRKSEERGEKMKSEEREEEEEEIKEGRSSMTSSVMEKKEKKRTPKREERERKTEVKEEEMDVEEEKPLEQREEKREAREETKGKKGKRQSRTPSPSKLVTSHSFDAAAAASAAPVPPVVQLLKMAAALPPPPPAARAAAAAPAEGKAPPLPAATAAAAEEESKACSITDTIEQVCQQLAVRAEKEKREREERERRAREISEQMKRDQEATALRESQQKALDEHQKPGPSKTEEEEDEFFDFSAVVRKKEEEEEEERAKKEARAEKPERKKGGKDREREAEGKEGKGKKKKVEEKERKKGGKKGEKRKEVDEDEEQEEAEFERLHREARSLGVPLPDLPDLTEEERASEGERRPPPPPPPPPPPRGAEVPAAVEEVEIEMRDSKKAHNSSQYPYVVTTVDKTAPPSTAKAKKNKKRNNAKKGGKKDDDDSDGGECPVLINRPPHASLSVLKGRCIKAMERDGTLNDFRPLGLPHITQSNLYGEKVVVNMDTFMKDRAQVFEHYNNVRATLAALDRRNRGQVKRETEQWHEEKDQRRAARRAAAAAAAAESPSTSRPTSSAGQQPGCSN